MCCRWASLIGCGNECAGDSKKLIGAGSKSGFPAAPAGFLPFASSHRLLLLVVMEKVVIVLWCLFLYSEAQIFRLNNSL